VALGYVSPHFVRSHLMALDDRIADHHERSAAWDEVRGKRFQEIERVVEVSRQIVRPSLSVVDPMLVFSLANLVQQGLQSGEVEAQRNLGLLSNGLPE